MMRAASVSAHVELRCSQPLAFCERVDNPPGFDTTSIRSKHSLESTGESHSPTTALRVPAK